MLERYYQELIGFFTRALRCRDNASDVVQESYARVLGLQLRAGLLAEPRALLYRVGKNLIIDDARRKRAEQAMLDTLAVVSPAMAPGADRVVSARQEAERLLARLAVMPRKRREVFLMVRIYGHTHAETAQHLDISIAAVEKHVVRAVIDCAQWQERRDGADHASS